MFITASINLSQRLVSNTLGNSHPNKLAAFHNLHIRCLKQLHKNLFTAKSSECIDLLSKLHTSIPYCAAFWRKENNKNNNNNNKIGKSILLSTWFNMHCRWSNHTNIINGQRRENKIVPPPPAFQDHSRSSLVTSRWIRSNYWPTSYTVSKIKGNFGRETQICRILYLMPPLRVLCLEFCNGVWARKLIICHTLRSCTTVLISL